MIPRDFLKLINLLLVTLMLAGALTALAQEKDGKRQTELPAEVSVSAEEVKKLEAVNQTARLAQLEFENLQLKIQQAQGQLKELQDRAKQASDDASNAYFAMLQKAGVPKDKIADYEVKQNADRGLTFKRKTAPVKE